MSNNEENRFESDLSISFVRADDLNYLHKQSISGHMLITTRNELTELCLQ